MTNIGNWFKDWLPDWLNYYTDSTSYRVYMDGSHVADALISELMCQMRLAVERDKELEQEHRRITSGGVDYGWLAISQSKSYTLSEIERLELESLCARVTAEESSPVMRAFRAALQRDPPANEIPAILRAVIQQVIQSRPNKKTSSGNSSTTSSTAWLSRSVARLRSLRQLTATVSVSSDDSAADVEMQSCDSTEAFHF